MRELDNTESLNSAKHSILRKNLDSRSIQVSVVEMWLESNSKL